MQLGTATYEVNHNGRSCNLTLYAKVHDLCINNPSIVSSLEAHEHLSTCSALQSQQHQYVYYRTILREVQRHSDPSPISVFIVPFLTFDGSFRLEQKNGGARRIMALVVCSFSRMICFSNAETHTSHVLPQDTRARPQSSQALLYQFQAMIGYSEVNK